MKYQILAIQKSKKKLLGLDLFSIIVNSTESLSENNQAELGDSPSMTFITQYRATVHLLNIFNMS